MRSLLWITGFWLALVCTAWRPACAQQAETHKLQSKRQRTATEVRVLAPQFKPDRKYRVLYVLPVEPGSGTRWGDPVAEFAKREIAKQQQVICVFPTFAEMPWYADHPTDEKLQQETYFLEDVIGLIESKYPVQKDRAGRLLIGFSKSGWGAFSLLLRYPDRFDRAAAFDAPLMMDWPSKYGSQPVFGTEENFRRYQVSKLVESRTEELRGRPRLAVIGAGNFQAEHVTFHQRLEALKIPHQYADGPPRKHHWKSGWIDETVEFLLTK